MPSLNCIIVDDEPLAIRLLEKHVAQVPELRLVGSFGNALEAMAFLRSTPVDIVFLDIQMPALNGLEFAAALADGARVIFTTAYRDYAVESYELGAADYLLKPITFARFYRAVNNLLSSTSYPPQAPTPSAASKTYRYFSVNKRRVRVALEDITYVESRKDYLTIFTPSQEIVTRGKISEFITEMPDYFLRTHRSFVVNLRRVVAYSAGEVEVEGGTVPIGVSYRTEVMRRLG